jgi:hypothetical protein
MTSVLKYSLAQMNDISFNGFHFEMPEDTFNLLNYLCEQVGSQQISSRTRVITKRKNLATDGRTRRQQDENWQSIRSFQTTKLEQKTGFEAELDQLRLLLNKLTDKTFLDVKDKIIERINNVCLQTNDETFLNKMGTVIYDICATNKFYSKIFADLFAELATMFEFIRLTFNDKYANFPEQYNDITYVDPNQDYDGFCEMNKTNERRKSVTTFYLNLALNGFINKEPIIIILNNIMATIMTMIHLQQHKHVVDELTENFSILFNDELFCGIEHNDITTFIVHISTLKAKDYPGLSSKTIFKYMDIVDSHN